MNEERRVKAWRIDATGQRELDGEETRDEGGRWHRPGRPLVYSASSCALALAEFLAHLEEEPNQLFAIEIEIPDSLKIDELDSAELPADWRRPRHEHCCERGEAWLAIAPERRAAILSVPSAVVPLERNLVIDPLHPDFPLVQVLRVECFELDRRLL